MMEDDDEEEEDDDMYPNYGDTATGHDEDEEAGGGDQDEEASDEPVDDDLHGNTKLGATLELLQWKAEGGICDKPFEKLLKIMKRRFPKDNELPDKTYEAKKVLCPLGLRQKIHACINDCILYRAEYENLEKCPICTALRYKIKRDDPGDVEGEPPRKRVPAKVMWYAPIIPRLKRLFRNKEHARLLRWHKEDRKKDEMPRHPADGSQWRKIDREFPDFADDARNLSFVASPRVMDIKVPQLEADLRAARAQCAESEEAGRSAAATLKVADGELARLRRLEENHLKELALLRMAEKEKVEELSKRLTEVEKQRLALQEEVTTKTTELSATAKRWVGEIGALDRGLSAAFPETQDAALAAVGVAREVMSTFPLLSCRQCWASKSRGL
ncbi:hypothetical protein QYE76_061794 [Lolium multiflorum]|uniref:Transposon protein, putative, CACTA, En/Spm sub-class n=1 Tax=Lolium multiflorum TaxID=4521 RepID=A0AAD8S2B0_LOLMU|nr:hypothetical protein QYE76_061794 [Lolium multiflorum]